MLFNRYGDYRHCENQERKRHPHERVCASFLLPGLPLALLTALLLGGSLSRRVERGILADVGLGRSLGGGLALLPGLLAACGISPFRGAAQQGRCPGRAVGRLRRVEYLRHTLGRLVCCCGFLAQGVHTLLKQTCHQGGGLFFKAQGLLCFLRG